MRGRAGLNFAAPERAQKQNAAAGQAPGHVEEQICRGAVDPLEIVEQQEQRLPPRERTQHLGILLEQPALWHIAESDLRTSVDVKLASALERTIGGPSIVRDTARLAGAVEVAQGVNIRNTLVDRIADSVQDPNQAREIRKARR